VNLEELILKKPASGPCFRSYVIAEAGVNHEGSMDLAKRLIAEAQEGGAEAIKFQTYKAETIASKDSPAYWDRTKESCDSQFKLFQRYDKFWKTEYEELKRVCDETGILFLSTPFDVESARFLNDLMPVFKVSSSDITNRPFIETMCDYRKPMLLSVGASTPSEIFEMVSWVETKGNPFSLLHCVLNYPTPDERAHLSQIPELKRLFPNTLIGYSDHTLPKDMRCLEMASLLGAEILEKHFTFDKTLPGNDHYHAMDKEDLKHFRKRMTELELFWGSPQMGAQPEEEPARRHARRSLVLARPVAAGTAIQREDLTWKRPAHGVSPKHIDDVVGRRARTNLDEDRVLQWTDLDA